MDNNDWNSLNEQDYDLLLQSSESELPPDDEIQEVTPWRKAMNRILFGMAMSVITLNFWGLNYILPTIGVFLPLLGFRMLRKDNAWFKGCWIITLLRIVYFLPSLILNATIFKSTVYASPLIRVFNIVNLLSIFLMLFLLWGGFRAAQNKVNLPANASSAVAMIVWYAVLCLLALIQYSGLIIALILIISYVLIIRSLFKLTIELDEASYAIQTAPARVPDVAVVTTILTLLAIGITCGYLLFNSYPMDWNPAKASNNAETKRIKEHLISLGFPKAILEDLTDEDIKACDGALRVVVDVMDYPANDGREVRERNNNTISYHTVYDIKELRMTGIGVELPGEREKWKIFHHFLWTIDPGFYGTECIQLLPAYRQDNGWVSTGDISGHVLYDMDGQVYIAPYYSLGNETYTTKNIFWGEQTSTNIFASFSMPKKGKNHRGYLSYTTIEIQDGWIMDTWIYYTHQKNWMQYPATTAIEKRTSNKQNYDKTFKTIHDALQFMPKNEELKPIN